VYWVLDVVDAHKVNVAVQLLSDGYLSDVSIGLVEADIVHSLVHNFYFLIMLNTPYLWLP